MLVSQLSFQLAPHPRGCHLITGEVRKALGTHLAWVSHGSLASLTANEDVDSHERAEHRKSKVAQRSDRHALRGNLEQRTEPALAVARLQGESVGAEEMCVRHVDHSAMLIEYLRARGQHRPEL